MLGEKDIKEFAYYVSSAYDISYEDVDRIIRREIARRLSELRRGLRVTVSVRDFATQNALADCRAWLSEERINEIALCDVIEHGDTWVVFHAITKRSDDGNL